jgi:hypothetical protein
VSKKAQLKTALNTTLRVWEDLQDLKYDERRAEVEAWRAEVAALVLDAKKVRLRNVSMSVALRRHLVMPR